MRAKHIDLGRKEKCLPWMTEARHIWHSFLKCLFFFSMITLSTAHEKSYPAWRRKGIDDFLCVNANAWLVISPVYRVFSHDVTAAILASQTMKRRPCWCPKPILWELYTFLMQTYSFVPINLHRCWPIEWKHSIYSRLGRTSLWH